MSASDVASFRNGASARWAESLSPAYAIIPRMRSCPCSSFGRNGIGGAGMTLAIDDNSYGAAKAAGAMTHRTMSAAARRELVCSLAGHRDNLGDVVGIDGLHDATIARTFDQCIRMAKTYRR